MHSLPGTFIDATPLLIRPEALRQQAQRDGYLFFRGFLETSRVVELRRHILGVLEADGFLRPDADSIEGIADLNRTRENTDFIGSGIPSASYLKVQQLESFNRFPHQAPLLELYRLMLDAEIMVHPGHIGRIIVPTGSPLVPIPPHQDHVHVRGTPRAWTCWTPLGAVPRRLGGLCILRGSHRNGVYPVRAANGGMEAVLSTRDTDWVDGDFEPGDVLTFSSLTVHRAHPNRTRDRIRLSMDFRYQPVHEPIARRSLAPHDATVPWETIYRHWKTTDLQYYWRRLDLRVQAPETDDASPESGSPRPDQPSPPQPFTG